MIIAGALIFGLLIVIINLWSGNEHDAQPVSKEYYIKAQHDENWIEKLVGDPVALFTLVLTGATVGLYLATRSLWVATDRLVRGAEETSERQLRAYVGVSRAEVMARDLQGNPTKLKMMIRNFGQTPAKDEIARIIWSPQPANFDHTAVPSTNDNPSTLMPGGDFEIIFDHSGGASMHLSAIVGRITYIDVFGNHRWTNVRMISRPGMDSFRFDNHGNESE